MQLVSVVVLLLTRCTARKQKRKRLGLVLIPRGLSWSYASEIDHSTSEDHASCQFQRITERLGWVIAALAGVNERSKRTSYEDRDSVSVKSSQGSHKSDKLSARTALLREQERAARGKSLD